MAEEQVAVEQGEKVTWEPVRKLAQDISELYSSKKIFVLKEESDLEETGATLLSERSARFTDPSANKCTISSADEGCVYLSKDITAPFRVTKLGISDKDNPLEKKVLAFEFAYDPDKYNEYLQGSATPVLTTQYLLYYEAIDNDASLYENVVYTSYHIALELSDADPIKNPTPNDRRTIVNLIESDRSKIKKFWDHDDEGNANYYSDSTEIAGELYMLFEGSSNPDCCYIARVAFAGLNNNGNGNSLNGDTGIPAPWVKAEESGESYVGSAEIPLKFVNVGESPWNSLSSYAVTLTGISMDRNSKSNSKAETNTTKGFRPETPGAADATYPPPPIGCSAEFIWPTIGTEGGGANSFYSTSIFSEYIDWADWRDAYRTTLTSDQLAKVARQLPPKDDDKHFPCYQGAERTGDKPSTYHYLPSVENTETAYQRWVQVNDTTYVRLAPMEFNDPSSADYKAYLTVPLTIAKVLKPKSYQTAIRKRWYDMLYYTLRNIAGYKYYSKPDKSYRVIGVTWDRLKINDTIYLNPCLAPDEDKEECLCTACSYERWKLLDLGGEGYNDDPDVTPFVGAKSEFTARNDEGNNAAQLWTWKQERLDQVAKHLKEAADHDILFPELYFERLLCYHNETLYSNKEGGFVNPQKENKLCECLLCYYTSYKESPIDMPWEGGGKNTTCKSEESNVTSYNTHAYTFKVLEYLTKFITDYKLPEDEPRAINTLEIGYCYCPATMGAMGISIKNKTISRYSCVDDSDASCYPETTTLELPEIPSYYNTLSENEKALLEPTGIECLVEIAKELKPFGYNAYIWKAVDIGGYSEHRKDIKIEFVHYNPARVCSSGTIMDHTLLEKFPIGKDDDPLYMYDTNCYTAAAETTVMREASPLNENNELPPAFTNMHICPNDEGSIRAFDRNRKDDATWEEAIYWSNKKRSKCYDQSSNMASAKIWHRDNELTSIGTIEIYVAPFLTPDGDGSHGNKAKFLGMCNIKRIPNDELPFNANDAIAYQVVNYACADIIPVSEAMNTDAQEVEINNDDSFTGNATNVITFEVKKQPTDDRSKPDENYAQIEITIPSELLIDEKPEGDSGMDLRQKYIILATRASHTNINSGLAKTSGQVSDNTPDNVKKWATTYAGACRYDEFKTAYKFSFAQEQ